MRALGICLALACCAAAQGGPLDMTAIQEALQPVGDAAKAAYEELLADSVLVEGCLKLSFTISRDGFVGDVSVEGDSLLEPVAEVLRTAVSELRFPALSAGSTPIQISVPFEFRLPEE